MQLVLHTRCLLCMLLLAIQCARGTYYKTDLFNLDNDDSTRNVKYHGSNELVIRTAPEYTRLIVDLIKLCQSSDDKIELRNEIRKCVTSLQCDNYYLRTFQLSILEVISHSFTESLLIYSFTHSGCNCSLLARDSTI